MAANDNPSPVKKRKLTHAPEGFANWKPNNRKAPAPKFASAFDDPKRCKMTPKNAPIRVPAPPKPIVSPPPAAESSNPSSLRVLCPPRLPLDPPQADPSRVVAAPEQPRKAPPVRPRKPPSFYSATSACKFTLNSHIPVRSGSAKPVLKASIQAFRPALPPAKPAKPQYPISAFQPPPPPLPKKGPPLPDRSKLKTISTTRFALQYDIRTESGQNNLLALQLAQTVSTYVPPAQRELNRGLGQSPEKASKAKAAKYIRGGLADRAQYWFSTQNMGLTLWQADMERAVNRPKTHSRLPPDLTLRIIEIAHVTSIASLQRSQNVQRLSIVKCAKIVDGRTIGDLTVVLDFGLPGSASGKAHTLDEVKEGKDLKMWLPWNSSDPDAERMRRFGALPKDGSILFCTRFRIE